MAVILVSVVAVSAGATTVDVATGTSGTIWHGQSFNETRGVDVTVQGLDSQVLSSMTLRGLNMSAPSGTVGARVYNSATQALIASADVAVVMGSNQTVTLPIAAVLAAGGSYRLCFFVSAEDFIGGSGTMFDPDPLSVGGFPYTESTGTLVVNQAYSTASDEFPGHDNFFVPLISAELRAGSVPTIATSWGSLRARYR